MSDLLTRVRRAMKQTRDNQQRREAQIRHHAGLDKPQNAKLGSAALNDLIDRNGAGPGSGQGYNQ